MKSTWNHDGGMKTDWVKMNPSLIPCSSAAYAAVTPSIKASKDVSVACDNQPTSFIQQLVSFLP